ncbi:hypothetical protein K474DRAFT_1680614 [Panus rudis PR-1116 ss-1]|nr:hypothetical protein K474DRAFT_1680614 [Panus rudis PR-1116 ss-1]
MGDRDIFDERVHFSIGRHTPITFTIHRRDGVAAWSSSNVEVRITEPPSTQRRHHGPIIQILIPSLSRISEPGTGRRLLTCVRTNVDEALVEANLSNCHRDLESLIFAARSKETFILPRAIQVFNSTRSETTGREDSASLTFASETAKQVFLGHILECWDARRIVKVVNEAHTWDEGRIESEEEVNDNVFWKVCEKCAAISADHADTVQREQHVIPDNFEFDFRPPFDQGLVPKVDHLAAYMTL